MQNKICDSNSNNNSNRCCIGNKEAVFRIVVVFLIITSVFMVFKTIGAYKSNKYIGQGVVGRTISFSGEGEVFSTADVANFSFSVVEETNTPDEAQSLVTTKINKVINFLKKENNISDKDIKTTGYNVSPRYEWRVDDVCSSLNCSSLGQKRVLVGYEANQSVSVKVKDIQKAGEILAGVGNFNVSNIGDLNFVIDNEDELKREARKLAIDDAKNKAMTLARDLDINLVKIVNFSESRVYPAYNRGLEMAMDSVMEKTEVEIPKIPIGENKITSKVTITYEIR